MSRAFKFGLWERVLFTAVLFVLISMVSMIAILAVKNANGGADPEFNTVAAQGNYLLIGTAILALWGRPASHYATRLTSRVKKRFLNHTNQ